MLIQLSLLQDFYPSVSTRRCHVSLTPLDGRVKLDIQHVPHSVPSLVRHQVEKYSSKNKLSHFPLCFLSVELLSEHLLIERSDSSPSFTLRRRASSVFSQRRCRFTVPLTSKMAASVICSRGTRINGPKRKWIFNPIRKMLPTHHINRAQ